MNELYHHGIKGQHWGQRNGPPYPLGSDQRSAEERKLNPRSSSGSDESWGTRNGLFSKKKAYQKEYDALKKVYDATSRDWMKEEGAERERLFKESSKLAAQLYDLEKQINSKSWGTRNGKEVTDVGKGYISSFGVRNGLLNPRKIKTKSAEEWDLVQAMDEYDSASRRLRNMDAGAERDEYAKRVDRLRKERNTLSEEMFGENYYFNNRWQQLWNDDEKHGQSDW